MNVFISYSVRNKHWAGTLKEELDSFGLKSFLAHEDLQVSEEWKDRILLELKKADIFVTLLSKDFKQSDWCSQEIGFIVSRKNVLIIPLSIDGTTPYGFFSHLQCSFLKKEEDLGPILVDVLCRKRPRVGIPIGIRRVGKAHSLPGSASTKEFARLTYSESFR